MSVPTDRLIDQLARDLPPVRRIASPMFRAACWLGVVAGVAVVLASRANLPALAARIESASDMWMAIVGSVATAILAAIAACMVSVPGRSRRWAWLPVPAAAFWLCAGGMGCLRVTVNAGLNPALLSAALHQCLPFILEMSAVLMLPLAVLLWWARPLRPGLVAGLAGLAVAAASASLLWFFHPFDASWEDLLVHALAVLLVVGLCRLVAALPRPGMRRFNSPAREH
jgi:hypothetical protein